MSRPESKIDLFIEGLIEYRRLVFSLVILFMAVGYLALNSMSRQEDPSFPYRAGLLKVVYPGGSPTQIEKLITEPLEEELAQIAEIDSTTSTSRDDLAIININLQDYVYDTDAAWDRVETAIERAERQFPAGVTQIELDDRQIDMPAAVLSITGSNDPILLEDAALKLKREIIAVSGVSRVEIEGAPEKEVIVKIDQDQINQLGISRQLIAQTISQRNSIVSGGLISSGIKNIRLNTQSDFGSLDELRRTLISLPNGQSVSLQTIADISIEPRLPLTTQVYHNGRRAVSIGVIAERGQVDVIKFGAALRERIDAYRSTLAPLKIEESFFQADYTEDRLVGLRSNLLISVFVIAAIVFFVMGWRTGILVSAVLPVVSMITIGLYSAGGGVFHQMAVIGMVISLGILIDNAIVVVENIEASLRKGVVLGQAIRNVIKVMAKPLFASTGTTIAAFIPLLLAEGGVGDFTRAVPIMICIALMVSYLLSILVLPLISFYWLGERKHAGAIAFQFTDSIAKKSATLVTRGPIRVLLVVGALLAVSLASSPFLKLEFFPSTDRAQIVIGMELPNNTPLELTSKVSEEIGQRIREHESVEQIYRTVGSAGFRFYYNMIGAPNESQVARFTVNTKSAQDNQALVDWVRRELKPDYPDAILTPRLLGQGPPIPAPIELRVKHNDLATLRSASQIVKRVMSGTRGITELRTDLDQGTPELRMSIEEIAVLNAGLQPDQVASSVFAESRGLFAGQYRYENDPIPIRVRSVLGQRSSLEVVQSQFVYSKNQSATPLNQLAAFTPAWSPTTLRHHNYQRAVTVLAQVKPDFAFNQVLAEFKQRMIDVDLPDGVILEYGGDAEASQKANSNIATAAPLAIGLLIFFMMYQFNSFRRISIVFVSIPLAAVGVIPGLVLSGQPFGFQSLLGVIALIGIVVNNAIVLIDVVDQSLDEGDDIETAVTKALQQRTAPILLTTATTIVGLLPLALSSSTLWPPMAWAIISGLSLSTLLTLVAIPALCVLLLGKKKFHCAPIRDTSNFAPQSLVSAIAVFSIVGALLVNSDQVFAQEANLEGTQANTMVAQPDLNASTIELTPKVVTALVQNNALVASANRQAEAARFDYQAQRRNAWGPKISLGGEVGFRDEASVISLPQPFGQLNINDDSSYVYEFKITQPLLNLGQQRYSTRASKNRASAADLESQAALHQATGNALRLYFSAVSLQQINESIKALSRSLASRLERINKELNAGRVLKTDLLQIEVALNRVRQQLLENTNAYQTTLAALKNSLNLAVDTQLLLGPIGEQSLTSQMLIQNELTCFNRAECAAIENQVKALAAQKKAVKASFLPKIDLSVSEVRSDGQLFAPDSDRRALIQFAWPLFSGGERLSQGKAIERRKQAQEQRLVAFQQQVRLDMISALAELSNAKSQLKLAKSSLVLDQERLRLSRERYEAGLLNVDELLDAEASLEQSKSDTVRAQVGVRLADVAIKLATGEAF